MHIWGSLEYRFFPKTDIKRLVELLKNLNHIHTHLSCVSKLFEKWIFFFRTITVAQVYNRVSVLSYDNFSRQKVVLTTEFSFSCKQETFISRAISQWRHPLYLSPCTPTVSAHCLFAATFLRFSDRHRASRQPQLLADVSFSPSDVFAFHSSAVDAHCRQHSGHKPKTWGEQHINIFYHILKCVN
jgi:hypothetical protein